MSEGIADSGSRDVDVSGGELEGKGKGKGKGKETKETKEGSRCIVKVRRQSRQGSWCEYSRKLRLAMHGIPHCAKPPNGLSIAPLFLTFRYP